MSRKISKRLWAKFCRREPIALEDVYDAGNRRRLATLRLLRKAGYRSRLKDAMPVLEHPQG